MLTIGNLLDYLPLITLQYCLVLQFVMFPSLEVLSPFIICLKYICMLAWFLFIIDYSFHFNFLFCGPYAILCDHVLSFLREKEMNEVSDLHVYCTDIIKSCLDIIASVYYPLGFKTINFFPWIHFDGNTKKWSHLKVFHGYFLGCFTGINQGYEI